MKFETDTQGLTNYEKAMHLGPKQMRKAVAKTLDKQAADTKFQHMPAALNDAFTIRDPKFMNRQLRFNKSKLNSTVSISGPSTISNPKSKKTVTVFLINCVKGCK